MSRSLQLIFATIVYVIFFATFTYLPLFVADLIVPKSTNTGTDGSLDLIIG